MNSSNSVKGKKRFKTAEDALTAAENGALAQTADRFWKKVDVRGADECWPWLGATDGRYGQFWYEGKVIRATRYSWSLHFGKPFPLDMDACHRCDNPVCVNPHHIFAGTPSRTA